MQPTPESPLVSVLSVVRNCEATIADTIRSVARQDYGRVEHLIQDGASTDDTLGVVRRLGGDAVRLESRRDSGIYDGFNNAIARATGSVIGFLNGDDVYASPFVLSVVASHFMDPAVDMVFGDVVYVQSRLDGPVVRYYSSAKFEPGRLVRGYIPAHPSLFVRRSLIDAVGPYDSSYRIAGDFEWISRAFQKASPRYAYVPQPLVRMRIGGASTDGVLATVRITREIKRACDKNGIKTSYFKLLTRFPSKILERFHV